MLRDSTGALLKEALAHPVARLGGDLLVDQASPLHCQALDAFAVKQDGLAKAAIDIGQDDVAQALVGLPPLNGIRRGRGSWPPWKEAWMPRKRYAAEQIIGLLRQAEVALAQRRTVGDICRELGVSGASFYRWRSDYGGLKVDQARRLKDLER